jgi:hypothetical protein
MAHHDPKKPTQVPDGDLSDALKKHEESDFNEDGDDEGDFSDNADDTQEYDDGDDD